MPAGVNPPVAEVNPAGVKPGDVIDSTAGLAAEPPYAAIELPIDASPPIIPVNAPV